MPHQSQTVSPQGAARAPGTSRSTAASTTSAATRTPPYARYHELMRRRRPSLPPRRQHHRRLPRLVPEATGGADLRGPSLAPPAVAVRQLPRRRRGMDDGVISSPTTSSRGSMPARLGAAPTAATPSPLSSGPSCAAEEDGPHRQDARSATSRSRCPTGGSRSSPNRSSARSSKRSSGRTSGDLVEFCWETGARPQEARLAEARRLNVETRPVGVPAKGIEGAETLAARLPHAACQRSYPSRREAPEGSALPQQRGNGLDDVSPSTAALLPACRKH